MLTVISAEYLDGYRIRVAFNNGTTGVVDLATSLWGPMFEPLKDLRLFRQFEVSPVLHTIRWPNNADFAPEFLIERIGSYASSS